MRSGTVVTLVDIAIPLFIIAAIIYRFVSDSE